MNYKERCGLCYQDPLKGCGSTTCHPSQGLLAHTGQFGHCHPFLAGCYHLPVFSISLVLNMTGLSD